MMTTLIPVGYILAAVVIGLVSMVAIVRYTAAEFGDGGPDEERDPATWLIAVLCAAVAGGLWPLTLAGLILVWLAKRLLAMSHRVDGWAAEAREMDPERRAAYEAAWRDLDDAERNT